jgi:hypothetical protein
MNLAALNCAAIAGVMKAEPGREHGLGPGDREGAGHPDLDHPAGKVRGLRRLHQADRGDRQARTVGRRAPVFSDGKPRFIQIKGINIDAEIGQHMLYTTNEDVPGIIGLLGMTMGKNGVNIANFTLGRSARGRTRSRSSTSTTRSGRIAGYLSQMRPRAKPETPCVSTPSATSTASLRCSKPRMTDRARPGRDR